MNDMPRGAGVGDVPSPVEIQRRPEYRLRDVTILLCGDETELPIAGSKGADEGRHISIPLEPTEALHRFEDTRGDPAEHQLPAAPALDVPLHRPRPADEAFDRVGGCERAAQAGRQLQREDGERLVEASRTLAAALGYSVSSRRARSCSRR